MGSKLARRFLRRTWCGLVLLTGIASATAGEPGTGTGCEPVPAWSVQGPLSIDEVGPEGGPFGTSYTYTLTNVGSRRIRWIARSPAQWVRFSNRFGRLNPGQSAEVVVTLDGNQAARLEPGHYSTFVKFRDRRDHGLDVDVQVRLEVQGDEGGGTSPPVPVTLSPTNRLSSSGPVGGPFAPDSQEYVLSNPGGSDVQWSASADRSWITLNSQGGTLAGGENTAVRVGVNAVAAGNLPEGSYDGLVTFTDLTSGIDRLRAVELEITAPTSGGGEVVTATSISQFGITWTFDQPYAVGQYANGDWWVVGPVNVIDIDPATTTSGGHTRHGSMINPSPRTGRRQGYDSSMFNEQQEGAGYAPGLNVALGVSAGNPLRVPVHSSLVSSITEPEDSLPQLTTCAILTVVGSAPSEGSFRPPYCGSDKQSYYNADQLNYGLLGTLSPVSSTPALASVEAMFERPWLDHVPDWPGRHLHPRLNMPDYGREIAETVGTGALMLHLDFTNEQKETLMIRFVQLGIDLWGIVQDGGDQSWLPNGGHASGRKWPILFAGLVLGDVDMMDIGSTDVMFGEDGQTFYVEETSPGVYNNGFGNYGPQHVGMPEWGWRHEVNRDMDDAGWFADPYRLCCTAHVWWGHILSAYIMDARALWNHEPFFDYQERYYQENQNRGITGDRLFWNDFQRDMWETHRASY